MHRIVVFAILGFALAVPSAKSQQPQTSTSLPPALSAEDETAVRGLVNGFADAWNRHDMNAMHDLDTDDVEWVNVVGHHWRGKETVRRGHTAIHKGMEAKTSMSVESTSLHPIAPNVTVVVATLHFFKTPTDPFYSGNGDTKTRASFTMVKRDGVWKIAQFQNTVVDPKAEHDDLPSFAETGFPPPGKP
ncbi:MAG TPA: SgcJ/EcaC family oxidoreductase [Terracidiphilus sp.]|nr:SgcJ/EcaC family oxidoreductase [Terracidiphilus sp.]